MKITIFIIIAGPACESNPCPNGVCEEKDDEYSYICNCNPGYSGAHCEIGMPQLFVTLLMLSIMLLAITKSWKAIEIKKIIFL